MRIKVLIMKFLLYSSSALSIVCMIAVQLFMRTVINLILLKEKLRQDRNHKPVLLYGHQLVLLPFV